MSGSRFDLNLTAEADRPVVHLALRDGAGRMLAEHQADLSTLRAGLLDGLFDLRGHLQRYADAQDQVQAMAEVGTCIAEVLLGDAIMAALWRPEHQRTLSICLPGAEIDATANSLPTLLARVPWEIARPAADQPTLAERNLLLRVLHAAEPPATQPLQLADDEPLRLLFVFAEARGSRPLAARAERLALLDMLQREVYLQRRVEAHVLCHGVTRARLAEQIRQHGGYHLLHWSGHGHLNLLELAGEPDARGAPGEPDHLCGEDLLAMFHAAGGLLPRLVFLSACHSGDIVSVRSWDDFRAAAAGREPAPAPGQAAPADAAAAKDGTASSPFDAAALERRIDTAGRPGFTGTAHALQQGGVPTVVAMRYAVGDDYARGLALEFYRALLADARPKTAAAALTFARRVLADPRRHDRRRHAVCDPATPVLYGAEDPGLPIPPGASPLLHPRNPCLHEIGEFQPEAHPHFVGRSWELAALGAGFIGASAGPSAGGSATAPLPRAAALITGLGGMGKTALVTEALALWRQRFQWVLLYQAKPQPLALDTVLRDIHLKLNAELGLYHAHVRRHPADAVYREATAGFDGDERQLRLAKNLLRAMKAEPLLLVIDNAETMLLPAVPPGVDAASEAARTGAETDAADTRCADPAWDTLLRTLAAGLVGSPSRLLVTSRRPLAALPATRCCRLPLGPLPALEAAHFLRQHPVLADWLFSTDPALQDRAHRLLAASRFHPLLMDRLARLAAQPGTQATLEAALAALGARAGGGGLGGETGATPGAGHAALPALFAARPGDAAELAYLEGALIDWVQRLLAELPVEGRQALWLVALTNQPETGALLDAVWRGEEDEATQQMRQMKAWLDNIGALPPQAQEELRRLPADIVAMLDALPPPPPQRPPLARWLHRLEALGLLNRQGATAVAVLPEGDAGDDDASATAAASSTVGADTALLAVAWNCHELVRERIVAWMQQRPADKADTSAAGWQAALAARLQVVFKAMQHQDLATALDAGSRALVYTVQAGEWGRLSEFASAVVTGSKDPRLLEVLLPHLQTAADVAPEGEPRWSCMTYLADALRNAGQPEASLPFYERAAALALRVTQAGADTEARQAWSDLGWILGNAAIAMHMTGGLDGARQARRDEADAKRRAGNPAIQVIGSELEALRIDLMRGEVEQALPEIESRLGQVTRWWQAHRAGRPVPEAPEGEFLARVYLGALDIAREADSALQDWPSALRRLDAVLKAKRELRRSAEDIAGDRLNRANLLAKLPGRLVEAKAELESCLEVFRHDPARCAKTLGSLASLYDDQGDAAQAVKLQRRALAIREQLSDPGDRAISHNNLARCLDRQVMPASHDEAPRHQLAALAYRLVAGLGQHLQSSLHGYAIDFRRARSTGEPAAILTLTDLLADPAFDPLARWLTQRQVDLRALQTNIDDFLAQARALAADDSRWE